MGAKSPSIVRESSDARRQEVVRKSPFDSSFFIIAVVRDVGSVREIQFVKSRQIARICVCILGFYRATDILQVPRVSVKEENLPKNIDLFDRVIRV